MRVEVRWRRVRKSKRAHPHERVSDLQHRIGSKDRACYSFAIDKRSVLASKVFDGPRIPGPNEARVRTGHRRSRDPNVERRGPSVPPRRAARLAAPNCDLLDPVEAVAGAARVRTVALQRDHEMLAELPRRLQSPGL